ncbi:hypothetical protein AVEN_172215-1 [Araneus ventricosus]|uniref:RNase H type-1 domain-containing protein n=1 Tax=Araneus ventricosus TaxID=182803 RepID=A0A4Y2TQH9_ARAVE|nr:hypothetical protein AVEN_172215-1 [Araneus ventricosus]
MAEVMSVDYCIDKNIRNSKVITDSRSTLMAIESTEEKRRIIIEIKKKLKLIKIQLQWVRAHNGTVGNERADALVKLAANKDKIEPNLVRKMLMLGIGARYYLLRNGKKDGIIQQRDHGLRNFSVKFNGLYGDFYYKQALTSHGVFGAHQERLFGKEGGCPCGEQLETIEHILLKCKIWGKERRLARKLASKRYFRLSILFTFQTGRYCHP